MNIQLLIKGSNNKIYEPILKDEIIWETERRGVAGKLTFTVIKDDIISFPEGAKVQLQVDGKGVFIGFVFQKTRNKDHHIECVAYDQLRYLKNKNTYMFVNVTATQVLQQVAEDFRLTLGTVENTGLRLGAYDCSNKSLFDTVLDALDKTTYATNKLYVLYDDFGKLCLKNIESMITDYLIDQDTAEDFNYTSSIDEDTYNQIKLVHVDSKTKKNTYYIAKDNNSIGNWGILQYHETINDASVGASMANAYLKLKNRKTRTLSVKGCLGDLSVRGGSSVGVVLNLGDVKENRKLVCNSVKHYISNNHHRMDLDLFDGNTYL